MNKLNFVRIIWMIMCVPMIYFIYQVGMKRPLDKSVMNPKTCEAYLRRCEATGVGSGVCKYHLEVHGKCKFQKD